MTVWVKICGITRIEDARAALEAGADAIGINFWPRSRRYCPPSRAREIVMALPAEFLVYGVFVDTPRTQIEAIVAEAGLTGVQLHGSEDMHAALHWSLPVIRAVGAASHAVAAAALQAASDAGSAEAAARGRYRVLLDNPAGGGSGRVIDPELLAGLDLSRAIVAGGLTPENVSDIVARFAPFGVDTAGGVEAAAGIKDPRLIEEFIAHARSAR